MSDLLRIFPHFLQNPTPHRNSTPILLDSDYGGMPDPMLSMISLLVQSCKSNRIKQHCWIVQALNLAFEGAQLLGLCQEFALL